MIDGTHRPISQLELNDILAGGARVEGILQFSGRSVPLWQLNGVYVSGSHLVESTDNPGTWHSVSDDPRATLTQHTEEYIYCLNTTTRVIPVVTDTGSIIWFRDWEELEDTDTRGQYEWNFRVMQELNKDAPHAQWGKIGGPNYYSAVSPNMQIATPNGKVPIASIRIGDTVFADVHNGTRTLTTVLGICNIITMSDVHNHFWATNMIVKDAGNGIWKREILTKDEISNTTGIHLITEAGTFVAYTDMDTDNTATYRDYTEVGYTRIEAVNECVEARLRP
jgi:hypothetical protein